MVERPIIDPIGRIVIVLVTQLNDLIKQILGVIAGRAGVVANVPQAFEFYNGYFVTNSEIPVVERCEICGTPAATGPGPGC